ncbi:hypothetical protein [Alicyclobacillus acidocaldarius]|uniref:hypothetical protein n=1 Tax=Alicyclobacillus acidocaldarius TaxID=405212 RepID=UPI00059F4242|nr:hypothetical protein [Alicyclobacillus acidocaldarius]
MAEYLLAVIGGDLLGAVLALVLIKLWDNEDLMWFVRVFFAALVLIALYPFILAGWGIYRAVERLRLVR